MFLRFIHWIRQLTFSSLNSILHGLVHLGIFNFFYRRTDRQTDRQTDGPSDKPNHRSSLPELKNRNIFEVIFTHVAQAIRGLFFWWNIAILGNFLVYTLLGTPPPSKLQDSQKESNIFIRLADFLTNIWTFKFVLNDVERQA